MTQLFSKNDKSGLTRDLIEALFPMFEQASAGGIAVDRQARITWINGSYASLLGIEDPAAVIGEPVRRVIPMTRMPEVVETGRPLLLDIMEYESQQLVVTRLPYFDDSGKVMGAVAFVLYDDLQPLTPLVSKYRRLHQDLVAARKALARKNRGTRYSLGDFVGASPAALEVKRRARLAAGRDMPVLLLGETGTGKEVLAQAIHALSRRADRPFVGVNVAAIPENLLEAEFFGVAPGAYTGADRRTRDGKFQLANGGTLFLDEVGDMPLALQAKLLRALQEGEIEPLGSNKVAQVDVRVIAATSRNLETMMEEGRFRSDLYYRLNVLEITIPPLRERLPDLGVLCEAILEDIAAGLELRAEITDAAVSALSSYDWPGNVRELRNVLERGLTMGEETGLLDADAIFKVLPRKSGRLQPVGAAQPARPLAQVLAEAELQAIEAALVASRGNRSRAARILGISRSALYEKLNKLS
ncbi:sigma-54 interaction domain-containing protein [Alloalcanivorax xenomutans]|uniref:sigma-54 interaction domain-containing protein n=1 Tax=Alloalcanivorax xenomutans TaxID=1094342 RepID=UPI0009B65DD1|nr:sigma 54-interacting transcriptional regulator [Alloalcanivorax xenomutans]MBA4719969.1 sigma 54-interacting transcriptional regulator [Alcanivorax sp.]ARB44565.1 Fis family transcriptional regulator [Alloalcanivorax xenomutans]PHS58216.1 MAG: sigma-54-dependent Fis family transcriptional regulator [Alcanivorax sp.]WOA32143.1 sigma 54-interacting transcriptional regulator [Alloalcanivorax xenomutans]WOD29108.1 sigma 54-interacting transcriptional regulator [Alloalcanivorax xenomutans]